MRRPAWPAALVDEPTALRSDSAFSCGLSNETHLDKLELTKMKLSYKRLHQELLQFAKSGYVDYLQVVWKQKLFQLCNLLAADMPSWLPLSFVNRLGEFKHLFSDLVPIISPMDQDDRMLLADTVQLLLQNWDSYIDRERPCNEEEILVCMAFERTSMKEFYRNELSKLGMTSFTRANSGPFQVTGQADAGPFYYSFHLLVRKTFGFYVSNMNSIVEYRVGSQSSLSSMDQN